MFKNLFGNNKARQLEAKLESGQLNWKHKKRIVTFESYPNYKSFIEGLEENDNIQFGLHSEVADEVAYNLILRQPLYDNNGNVVFNFQLFFNAIPLIDKLSMMGIISDYNKPQSLLVPNKSFLITKSISESTNDLSISEYHKLYSEILTQSLSIQGHNPNKFSTSRKNNLLCENMRLEKKIREQYQ